MLDMQKLVQEFVFLREKLQEISGFIASEEYTKAAFMIGILHALCHNHAVNLNQMFPPAPAPEQEPAPQPEAVQPEAPKDESAI